MTKLDKCILYHYAYAALYGDLSQSCYGIGKNQSSILPFTGQKSCTFTILCRVPLTNYIYTPYKILFRSLEVQICQYGFYIIG